ncbi:MAG: response regulator, partial [Spirochaetia bacterium]|nr:response regulator [Spirochaetia bacterium]
MISYENLLADYVENSPYAIFIFNKDFEILKANKSFKLLAGRYGEEPAGKNLAYLLSRDFMKEFISRLNEIGNTGTGSIRYEYSEKEKPGKFYTVRIHSAADEQGEKLFIGLIDDISELKTAEKQLEEAKGLAEQAAKTKSDFLANVSHEIRTPLHTIMGMSELILDTPLDVEQKEYSDQILFSAGVLLSLVNDILDFSKIEAGKLELENIAYNLYETLEDAVTLIAMEAHKKGLEVVLSISPDVPEIIEGDPVRLRQVVMNLLNNAIKFTKKGEIVVSACMESMASASGEEMKIRFSVSDTGIGIPESRKNLLFNVFTQVDSSITRKYGGTGLGLSISKKLAELFGGEIGLESTEGAGSLFWFTIRTRISALQEVRHSLAIKLPVKIDILLVDDNETSRKQVKKYLDEIGIRVYEADNGKEAISFLASYSRGAADIDLMLIDQRMPGMDGWQLASEIKSESRYSEIKKILMTPIGMGGDEAKMKLLNWFDGYINKPVKKRQLYSAVFKALGIAMDAEEEDSTAGQELSVIQELLLNSKKKFLLAEDYYINQKLFKTILNNFNIDVSVADNGLEAVELARKEKFDLILMDIQMPVMNGFDASRRIKEMGVTTPIIAVTANAIAGEREKCLEAGMDDFLSKPFKKGDLVPLFSKWLIVGDEVADLEELDPVPEKSGNSIHVNNGKPVVLPKAPPAGTLTGGTAAKAVMPEMIDYNDA